MHSGTTDGRMRKRSGLLQDTKSNGPDWRRPKAGARKNKKARKHREARRKSKEWLDQELVAVEGECQAECEVEEQRMAEVQEDLAMLQLIEDEEERLFDYQWEDER
jgi:hypothetical protein